MTLPARFRTDAGMRMAEPTSGTAASVAGWKVIGGLAGLGAIGAGLASVVVMCLMRPRDGREWSVALISTVVSSIAGGAFVVQYFGLQEWATNPFGLMTLFGLAFACGLPGWAIVRWTFNYFTAHHDDDIAQVIEDARKRIGR